MYKINDYKILKMIAVCNSSTDPVLLRHDNREKAAFHFQTIGKLLLYN